MQPQENIKFPSLVSDTGGCFPELMTEEELIRFLRIPEISKSKDHHNVVKNLIRMRNLPRLQICNTILFPQKAVLEWVEKETVRK